MGHVMRCVALADMLKNDFKIFFAIQEPEKNVIKNINVATKKLIILPSSKDYNQDALNFSNFLLSTDIVVLDGYNFRNTYQKIIKDKGCQLVAIDDLYSWHHLADVVINHAPEVSKYSYSKEASSRLYFGLDYALLRKEFLASKSPTEEKFFLKRIFLNMGASDQNNNILIPVQKVIK
jgi:UDP-2,4-diacetamido-2,4,6-trideoxy-beta-L-altropyranose hydrolase